MKKVIQALLSTTKTKNKKTEQNKKWKPARISWSCCPALHRTLSPVFPAPSHPSFLFSKRIRPWSLHLESWIYSFSYARTFHYVTAAWIQIPQLEDKLLWGQGLYLIHLCVSSVTWLRIGTHKMSVKWIGESPDTWIRLPQKCLWPKSECRVSEVTY